MSLHGACCSYITIHFLVDHKWTSTNDHSDCNLHYGSSTAIADCRIFFLLGYVLGGGGIVGLQAAAGMKLFQLFWRQQMWQAVMEMYAGSVCSKKKTNGHAKSVCIEDKHKVGKGMTIMYDKMCDNNLMSCRSCRAKIKLQSLLVSEVSQVIFEGVAYIQNNIWQQYLCRFVWASKMNDAAWQAARLPQHLHAISWIQEDRKRFKQCTSVQSLYIRCVSIYIQCIIFLRSQKKQHILTYAICRVYVSTTGVYVIQHMSWNSKYRYVVFY